MVYDFIRKVENFHIWLTKKLTMHKKTNNLLLDFKIYFTNIFNGVKLKEYLQILQS